MPLEVPRQKFVDVVFELGTEYDAIMAAIEIGDKFISDSGEIIPFAGNKKKLDTSEENKIIANQPIEKIYTIELAHVVLSIAEGAYTDDGYQINEAVNDLENKYLYKMHWEICQINNFSVSLRLKNFITFCGKILYCIDPTGLSILGEDFFHIAHHICLNRDLMNVNPITIFIGFFLLFKRYQCRLNLLLKPRVKKIYRLINLIHENYQIPEIDIKTEILKI